MKPTDSNKIREDVKVFVRILPMQNICFENVKILQDKKTIFAKSLQDDCLLGKEHWVPKYWAFETDGVLYNENQNFVYDCVMTGVLESVINGKNALIVSYGQTGTGKTLTTSGLNYMFEDRGLGPRIIANIYELKEKHKRDMDIRIKISYVEIMKETAMDILKNDETKLNSQSLKCISAIKPKNAFGALKLLFQAEARRNTQELGGYESHCCHGVLTIHVATKSCSISNALWKHFKIHVVDLAGCDSLGHSTSDWKNVDEIGNANSSKTFMEQYLLILAEKIPEAIHCKKHLNLLIMYLSDALEFGNVLRFIGHVRVNKENLAVTISMLRFSQLIKGLPMFVYSDKINKVVNDEENNSLRMSYKMKKLKELETLNCLNSMLMNEDLSIDSTQERKKLVERISERYLSDEINEIMLLNITDVNVALKMFKEKYNILHKTLEENNRKIYERAYRDALEKIKNASKHSTNTMGSLHSTSKKKPEDEQSSSTSMSTAKRRSKKSLAGDHKKKSIMSTISEKSKTSRKSIVSASSRQDDEEKPNEEIPKTMPNNEETWKAYIDDEEYKYKYFHEIRTNLEEDYVRFKQEYLNELEVEKQTIARYNHALEDLTKLQLSVNFAPWKVYNADLKLETLKSKVNDLKTEIANQRETVLKAQSEIRITLEEIMKIKENIARDYEKFSTEKYGIPLTSIVDTIEDFSIDEMSLPKDETYLHSAVYNELMKYQVLQNEMKRQKIMKRKKLKKKKEWVRYFKT